VLPMWTVQAVLVPPSPVGPLQCHGAAALVEDAAHEAGELYGHWIAQVVGAERAGIDVHEVLAEEAALDSVRDRWAGLLRGLIADTPDLAGWDTDVVVRVEEDTEEDGGEDEPTEAAVGGEAGADGEADGEAREALVDSLVRSADLFRGLPMEQLLPADFDALGADERGDVLARATYLAGCMIEAAVIVTDHLFEDVETLGADAEADPEDLWVVGELPERYAAHYTGLFARRFLVAFTDMTRRLTAGWEPLANLAQELGVRLLLDHVELVAELAEVALPEAWRSTVEELLLPDADLDYLYEDDGETEEELDWFVPYAEDRHLPVYATDQPVE
jgi:hypothetical protein